MIETLPRKVFALDVGVHTWTQINDYVFDIEGFYFRINDIADFHILKDILR